MLDRHHEMLIIVVLVTRLTRGQKERTVIIYVVMIWCKYVMGVGTQVILLCVSQIVYI